jgi:hypothetical protein
VVSVVIASRKSSSVDETTSHSVFRTTENKEKLLYCCDTFVVDSDNGCNIFGCNCDGPCWNFGVIPSCGRSDGQPDKPVTCQGDFIEGDTRYYYCCPSNSVCGSDPNQRECKDCNYKYEIVEIVDLKYDSSKMSKTGDATALKVSLEYRGVNSGSSPTPIGEVSGSISQTQSFEYSFSSDTTISASTTVKTGLPGIVEGQIEIGLEQTFGYSETTSKSITKTLGFAVGAYDNVPPYSYQNFEFVSSMYM